MGTRKSAVDPAARIAAIAALSANTESKPKRVRKSKDTVEHQPAEIVTESPVEPVDVPTGWDKSATGATDAVIYGPFLVDDGTRYLGALPEPEPSDMPVAPVLADLTALVDRISQESDKQSASTLLDALKAHVGALRPIAARREPSSTRTYVRIMPTGKVTVTLHLPDGDVSLSSMGDAARTLAKEFSTARKCQAYVTRVDVYKRTANARVFIETDVRDGRIPAGIVEFGTK